MVTARQTVSEGLLIRLKAKPGQEDQVMNFLGGVMPLIQEEPATTALFGIRFSSSEFGIFNAFPDEAGRQAHMGGHAASALFQRAEELFSEPPSVETIDILAAKLPG